MLSTDWVCAAMANANGSTAKKLVMVALRVLILGVPPRNGLPEAILNLLISISIVGISSLQASCLRGLFAIFRGSFRSRLGMQARS